MKRPFLQFAIQKIESLFQKGKDNPTLMRQIKNELEHRKSKRSKILENRIDAKIVITDLDNFDKEQAATESKSLEEKRIPDEKSGTFDSTVNSDISEKSDINIEDLLRSIKLRDFAKTYDVPVRVKNVIIEEANFIKFETVYDFISSSKTDRIGLIELPNFGQKSLTDLSKSIDKFVCEKTGKSIDKYPIKELLSHQVICKNIKKFNSIEDLINFLIDKVLNDREKNITKFRKTETLEKIGGKYKITRERVRQIEKNIIKKLRFGISLEDVSTSRDNFQCEIDSYFFNNNNFIMEGQAKKIYKEMPREIILYIKIVNDNLTIFLNEHYSYNASYLGWSKDKNTSVNSYIVIDDSHVSLDDAVRKSDWPITLSQLEVLMSLPGNVILSKINQSKNYNVRLLHSDKIITPIKISKRNRIMYVLRRRRGAMKLLEIVNDYVDLFKADITKHYVSNTLALMKDALIVDKGTYNLYENISINNDEIESVRNKTETFLLEKQKYTSSKIILRYLKEVYNNEYLRILNGHFLLGILQDDDRFDCQRGLMIGLTSSKFDAINTDQTTEVIKLMNRQGKPLNTEYIVNSMSSYRQVSKDNIKNLLEAKNELFYCSAPGEFYLIDKKNDIKSTTESENTISNTFRKQRKKKRLLKMASMLSNENKE
jgi:hypothetical protein